MSFAADYQSYAEDCLKMAEQLPLSLRPALLQLAKAWLELAASETPREPDVQQDRPLANYKRH